MSQMFDQAMSWQPPTVAEPIEVTAELREITQLGKVIIDYKPDIIAVPDDWGKLWDMSEREKMAPADREVFEEKLLDIMHCQFVQNSLEVPQRYFTSNLTVFSEKGIEVNLNFSDPLLISAGAEADTIRIKLLKSYFLTNNAELAKKYQERSLATLSEDEKYLVIESDIPRQVKNEADMIMLEDAMSSAIEAF